MLKREITYEDFNDETVTEVFYFNLSEAELIEMELEVEGGMGEFLQGIVESKDHSSLVKQFKALVLKAYGEKSEDGKRFVKNDAMREAFSQTAAYNKLFTSLATDENAAVSFIEGVLPKNLRVDPHANPQMPKPNEAVKSNVFADGPPLLPQAGQ